MQQVSVVSVGQPSPGSRQAGTQGGNIINQRNNKKGGRIGHAPSRHSLNLIQPCGSSPLSPSSPHTDTIRGGNI